MPLFTMAHILINYVVYFHYYREDIQDIPSSLFIETPFLPATNYFLQKFKKKTL